MAHGLWHDCVVYVIIVQFNNTGLFFWASVKQLVYDEKPKTVDHLEKKYLKIHLCIRLPLKLFLLI